MHVRCNFPHFLWKTKVHRGHKPLCRQVLSGCLLNGQGAKVGVVNIVRCLEQEPQPVMCVRPSTNMFRSKYKSRSRP